MKISKKGQHAISFALFATDWDYYYNEKHGEYMFHNAPKGFEPVREKKKALTPDELYKKFLKNQPKRV